jgi:hypothetical protein
VGAALVGFGSGSDAVKLVGGEFASSGEEPGAAVNSDVDVVGSING